MFRPRIVAMMSFVLLAVVATGAMTSAVAEDRQAKPPEPIVNSWALAPSGTNPGEPGSRPNLSYELAPGAKVADSVTLFNYSNTQLTFRIYPTDAFNDLTGGFALLAGDKQPTDAGTWVTLPQANVTLSARTQVVMPISVAVPPNATPGDHAAAILASSTVAGRDSGGKVVTLDRRTGTRLYIRVAGKLSPQLTVQRLHTTYHPALNPLDGSLDVTYTLRNTGNERLGTHQRLVVKSPFGTQLKATTPSDLPEMLPGNEVTISAHFNGVAAVVRTATQVVLSPFPVGDANASAAPAVSRTGHAWAIPWTVLAAVALASLAWQARRRMTYRGQQRHQTATTSRPVDSYAPTPN